MRKLIDIVSRLVRGNDLFEMANLRPSTTGLTFVVFVSQKGGAKHDVRIKVSDSPTAKPSEMITVALRPTVRVTGGGELSKDKLDSLTKWVALNQTVLQDFWDGQIEYTEDMVSQLVKL